MWSLVRQASKSPNVPWNVSSWLFQYNLVLFVLTSFCALQGQLPLFAAILATAAPPFVIVCLTWAITRGMNGQVGRIEASSIAGVNFTLR